jgi:hypothetical protein
MQHRTPLGVATAVLAMVVLVVSAPIGAADTTTTTVHTPPPTSLTGVGVSAQAGYDQVVFEFAGQVPGATVSVVSAPIVADASGQVVPVAGTAFVQITLKPSSGVDLTAPGAPRTYTGPTRIALHGASIVEVVQTGDFEGVLTWVVGLTTAVPFTTVTAAAPARLAVDFQHPATSTNPSFTG